MSASWSSFRDGKGAASGGGSPPSTGKGGLCFTCHLPGHKQANSPVRRAKDRAGDARVAARNFACAVETPVHCTSAIYRYRSCRRRSTSRVSVIDNRSRVTLVCLSPNNVYRADGKTRSTCNAGDRRVPRHDKGVQC
jgi:hypothetical protein